uniref:Uncharacterized protein n=1 Tax=Arundo donax TaxID=35708 RepID=A0A0A9D5F1_ARUDO
MVQNQPQLAWKSAILLKVYDMGIKLQRILPQWWLHLWYKIRMVQNQPQLAWKSAILLKVYDIAIRYQITKNFLVQWWLRLWLV